MPFFPSCVSCSGRSGIVISATKLEAILGNTGRRAIGTYYGCWETVEGGSYSCSELAEL